MRICPICLNNRFGQVEILKERLIAEWELAPAEIDYINKQQGLFCEKCKSNLRSMTLAESIMRYYSYNGAFQEFFNSTKGKKLHVLEINEAGSLHSYFLQANKYSFAEYPIVDIHHMPYADNTFDMIVHSDTLEHVENSKLALKECFRVLKENGAMFYTIPIVYGRLTRRRNNLPDSFHGIQEAAQGNDYKVWTEYGADFWVELINSDFNELHFYTIEKLASVAIIASKFSKNRRNILNLSSFKQNAFKISINLLKSVKRELMHYLIKK